MINQFIEELRKGEIGIVINTKSDYDIITGHLREHRVGVTAISWYNDACNNPYANFTIHENQLHLDEANRLTNVITVEDFCHKLYPSI